jgi:glucose/arabinose dehydrogenase
MEGRNTMRRFVVLVGILGIVALGVPRAEGSATVIAVPVVDTETEVVAFTFLPDGRIVYGERFTGRIFIFDPATEESSLFFRVPRVIRGAERGLLGLAVHPLHPGKPFVYVYASRDLGGGELRNQILRITDSGGVGTMARVIWTEDVTANIAHVGGRLLFGPNGKLHFVVGDNVEAANAQDLTNDPGKVHRVTDKGRIPPDNPFPGSSIWSYGHRNHFGLAFDPLTGNLWQSENGPSCNDEWNLILKGANYGWGPLSDANDCTEPPPAPENTNQDGPEPRLPEAWFTPTTAPVGMTFCDGCGLADSEGTLFVGHFNGARIMRGVLTPDRQGIESTTVAYQHAEFSVVSLETAPDGTIHFNDFNTIYKLVEG